MVYKPLSGDLSRREQEILGDLNSLVLKGELLLEDLQRAIIARAKESKEPFNDQYALALHLTTRLKPSLRQPPIAMGAASDLLSILRERQLDTIEAFAPYLKRLKSKLDGRPLVDQILDLVVGNGEFPLQKLSSPALQQANRTHDPNMSDRSAEFLSWWGSMEKCLTAIVRVSGSRFKAKFELGDLFRLAQQRRIPFQVPAMVELVESVRVDVENGTAADAEINEAQHKISEILRSLSVHSPFAASVIKQMGIDLDEKR